MGRLLLPVAAVAVVVALAGCSAASADRRGAQVRHFAVHSALVRRTLNQTLVIPAGTSGRGRPLLVLLHGRGGDEDSELNGELFAALRHLGDRAPDLLFPYGGDHSYWHDRRDGRWGAYVVREAIPAAIRRLGADGARVAVGGFSMGGFGAFALAREHPRRFCAVGGHSAAVWTSARATAPGAFDDAADYARHDVFGPARRRAHPFGDVPLWLDVGAADPFRSADTTLAAALRAHRADLRFSVRPGEHGGTYWRSRYPEYLRFYADALARCRRR